MAATAGDAPKKIKLISCEGDEVLVEPEVALMSSFVRTMLEDSSDAVPLPQVRTAVLEKIIDYCRYHHQNPHETVEIAKPLKSSNIADVSYTVQHTFHQLLVVTIVVLFRVLFRLFVHGTPSLLTLTRRC
eukprot:GHVQ01004784.1.p1 GENE.GHVQ01004784.1~~GHVQ01004784.1.p1  ORF type:complete len:130 (+),score=18.90 GHVQ01004784.1:152-541(+)